MAQRANGRAAYYILGGFILALVILVLWFVLDLGGVAPGDSPVLPPEEPASVLPDAS